ncbi:hypothetical protein HSTV2_97 [Halorubrum sodomense tailed virus 2]|uniref:Uncharacterized protein n=1 Tax=Halorubrum sodomense tailed virus 2 TaxID=1262527 RepID=L7TGQ4_9CAUD|nr:hypothetical protein HSTV2_97 [Halorubrum sodomense tailed virus 2]AGC34364.1 hypothetical protein HSTV2_97 [Halorubrum sodomense tailed virus 2]
MSVASLGELAGMEMPETGDEVMAEIPWEGVVVGEVLDAGPRYTILLDGGEMVEVDERNVWKNGDGYSIRPSEVEGRIR